MARSILIKLNEPLSRNQVKEKVSQFFSKEQSEDELLLSFNSKWIWFFFEDFEESEYNIQFSSDFEQLERVNFLIELRCVLDYTVIDSDI